jgi:hypothetical protein
MGQERFADVVERFTHGYGNGHGPEPAPEVMRRWQEELERTLKRMQNLQRMVTDPTEPKVGQTPRVEIYRRNKSRLYRYQSPHAPDAAALRAQPRHQPALHLRPHARRLLRGAYDP